MTGPFRVGSIELPPREIFPAEMPRYPNLWFLVDQRIPHRPRYLSAVRWLVGVLEDRLDLRDSFTDDVENPNLRRLLSKPGEGSDFQARIGPIQRHEHPKDPARSHWHQLHARFYVTPLSEGGRRKHGEHFLIPASVHYEVATEEPLHPYADDCPFCGITGDYGVSIAPGSQDYCEKVHDPLGVEFLLTGRIRGKVIKGRRRKPVPSLADLPCEIQTIQCDRPAPAVLGLVTFNKNDTS